MSSSVSSPTPASGGNFFAVDTSIMILSLRGDTGVRARLATATKLYIPSVALGELYFGAFGSPTRSDAAAADVAALAATNTVLATDVTTAEVYGRVKQELKQQGLAMPDNDVWIAAIAIQYDITLVARDAHFNWISALRVEQWSFAWSNGNEGTTLRHSGYPSGATYLA